MWYKQYGSTGKAVSTIGFGGMRFPKLSADKPDYDFDACAEIVHEACRQGINYVDTAPYYCDDKSELIVGHAFAQRKAQGLELPYVSTKSGEKDGAKLRAQLETSLKRLGVPKITFFHIWCVLNLDDYRSRLVPGGAYEAAKKAQSEGLIDHVVFSTHCNGAEIETMVNDRLFEGITLGYNILNFRFRQQGLEACQRHNLGVVTMNPLGGGLIPHRGEKLAFLKAAGDPSVIESALAFNASHEAITVVLPGMGSVAEVAQNAAVGHALGEQARVPDAPRVFDLFVKARKTELEGHMHSALDTLCTGCQYCLPCPQDITIPKFLLSYNETIFGKPSDTLGMMKGHWGITADEAARCVECGACEDRCTQHLPIIGRLKEIVASAAAQTT